MKIYLGMAAGVGKTYAMLSDACSERLKGADVVAGYIELHGRVDTERLAHSLEQIPPKLVEHRGVSLREFDIDAALSRSPTILLVDELAHHNPPGFRHEKRWQDIEELLDAGIHVYTTVNVQHLESLNDVVSKITGVAVRETVPDSILARADSVELVDLPPEELIQRVREGKVYPSHRIEHALQNFFTKSNLIALRELVLRQVADRVDLDLLELRAQNLEDDVWATKSRIIVCIGANSFAHRLIRAAKRIATQQKAELIVLTVERPSAKPPDAANRQMLSSAIQLAESLDAQVIVRRGEDIVGEMISVARERNATLIVVGKALRPPWHSIIFRSLPDELIRRSGTIPVQVLAVQRDSLKRAAPRMQIKSRNLWRLLVPPVVVAVAMTLVCFALSPWLAVANIAMLYLIGVVWVACRFGVITTVVTSALCVACFDFYFVPPYYTFVVHDAQYLVTFLVMLVVGSLISTLTSRIGHQAEVVLERERRTSNLYDICRSLLQVKAIEDIAPLIGQRLRELLQRDSMVMMRTPEAQRIVLESRAHFETDSSEAAVIEWVFRNHSNAGFGTETLSGARALYVPLLSHDQCFGVLGVSALGGGLSIDHRDLIEACAGQLALTLNRLSLESQRAQVQLQVEREQMKNTLLSAVSHDLRTPLTVIQGAAEMLTLQLTSNVNDAVRSKGLAESIAGQAARLSRMVQNILDMTRIEQDQLRLTCEWESLEELIAGALSRTEPLLVGHTVSVNIPRDIPLIFVDGSLIEQMLVNILENAARYTPVASTVTVCAGRSGQTLWLEIFDNGPGIVPGMEERIFDKLQRGRVEDGVGFGLGLTICRAIVEAHHGSISARAMQPRGACFRIELPVPSDQTFSPVADTPSQEDG